MDKARTAELKKMLLKCRNETSADIKDKLRNLKEEGSSTTRRVVANENHGDYCDVQEMDIELEWSLVQMANNKLALINEALRWLEAGRYGLCENEDCGEEISEKRLKALLFAIRCKDCEELRESSRAKSA